MAPLLGRDDKKEIEKLFRSGLVGEVKVVFFTSKRLDCAYCGQTRQLLEEVVSLTDKIKLEVIDADEAPRAEEPHVDLVPTTVILASNGAKLCYVGMPAGRQLRCFVEDLVDVSRGRTEADEETKATIKRITRPTAIKVFVTPTCLYSPLVVRSAHRFALENPLVSASMIETLEFPDLARKYNVVGTPRTVIDDRIVFDGAPAEKAFAEKVLEASVSS